MCITSHWWFLQFPKSANQKESGNWGAASSSAKVALRGSRSPALSISIVRMMVMPDFAYALAFAFPMQYGRASRSFHRFPLFSCFLSCFLGRLLFGHTKFILPKHGSERAALHDATVLALRGVFEIFPTECANRYDVPTSQITHLL